MTFLSGTVSQEIVYTDVNNKGYFIEISQGINKNLVWGL